MGVTFFYRIFPSATHSTGAHVPGLSYAGSTMPAACKVKAAQLIEENCVYCDGATKEHGFVDLGIVSGHSRLALRHPACLKMEQNLIKPRQCANEEPDRMSEVACKAMYENLVGNLQARSLYDTAAATALSDQNFVKNSLGRGTCKLVYRPGGSVRGELVKDDDCPLSSCASKKPTVGLGGTGLTQKCDGTEVVRACVSPQLLRVRLDPIRFALLNSSHYLGLSTSCIKDFLVHCSVPMPMCK